ncbi:MAG: hypothetical protein ACHREM_23520 [Polyangiales bacterium]
MIAIPIVCFLVGLLMTALGIKGVVHFSKNRSDNNLSSLIAIVTLTAFALLGFFMSGCSAWLLVGV